MSFENNDSMSFEIDTLVVRPENVTNFLSHLFPTERDRLYFELVRDSYVWDPEAKIAHNRIQLVVNNHEYIEKYNRLRDNHEYTSRYVNSSGFGTIGFCGFCENERTISENFGNNYVAIYDIHNTDRDINKQKEFINKMSNDEFNEYIFIVRENLIENNDLIKSYSLSEYNNDDYVFTYRDREVYGNYLCDLHRLMCIVCNGKWQSINNIFDMIDIYLEVFGQMTVKQ